MCGGGTDQLHPLPHKPIYAVEVEIHDNSFINYINYVLT